MVDLKETLAAINRMEAAKVIDRWAIGGATGATFFLEPLVTEDVDVFVKLHPSPGGILLTLEPIFAYLKAEGAVQEGEYLVIGGWPVQFLPPTSLLVEEALDQAIQTDLEGVPLRVLSAEHLAAIALETGRAKDKARLQLFYQSSRLDRPRFFEIVARHGLDLKWQSFERQFLGGEP